MFRGPFRGEAFEIAAKRERVEERRGVGRKELDQRRRERRAQDVGDEFGRGKGVDRAAPVMRQRRRLRGRGVVQRQGRILFRVEPGQDAAQDRGDREGDDNLEQGNALAVLGAVFHGFRLPLDVFGVAEAMFNGLINAGSVPPWFSKNNIEYTIFLRVYLNKY